MTSKSLSSGAEVFSVRDGGKGDLKRRVATSPADRHPSESCQVHGICKRHRPLYSRPQAKQMVDAALLAVFLFSHFSARYQTALLPFRALFPSILFREPLLSHLLCRFLMCLSLHFFPIPWGTCALSHPRSCLSVFPHSLPPPASFPLTSRAHHMERCPKCHTALPPLCAVHALVSCCSKALMAYQTLAQGLLLPSLRMLSPGLASSGFSISCSATIRGE